MYVNLIHKPKADFSVADLAAGGGLLSPGQGDKICPVGTVLKNGKCVPIADKSVAPDTPIEDVSKTVHPGNKKKQITRKDIIHDTSSSPHEVPFKKVDEDLQIVWAEVYVPMIPDVDGDFMTAEEIRKMAHSFLKKGAVSQVDVNHDNQLYGSYVVESFIVRKEDPDFIEGAWVAGIYVGNPTLWEMIKSGDLNGFSMEAFAKRTPVKLALNIPPIVKGETDEAESHSHEFKVDFSEDGTFLGGTTSEANSHRHRITKGTLTEPAGSPEHTHRFSVLEGFVDA